jgi:hypothetical protein
MLTRQAENPFVMILIDGNGMIVGISVVLHPTSLTSAVSGRAGS